MSKRNASVTCESLDRDDSFAETDRLVEARDTPPCHAGSTLAFTQPGAPMIRICSLQFRAPFAQDRRSAENTRPTLSESLLAASPASRDMLVGRP